MSLPAFLTESSSPAFIQSADNSVNLITDDTDHDDSLEKRLERVKYCMSMRQVFDPHTGLPRSMPTPCRVWRLCQICGRQRRKDNRERLERAVSEGPVRKVEFRAGESSKNVIRKYGKEVVIRYPTLDNDGGDCEVVFISTSDDIGQAMDADTVKRLPWSRIVMTPEGKKISGQLGKVAKAESTGEVVKQTSFVIEGLDDTQQEEAQRAAIRQTIELDPQTLEDLQKAMVKRESAYIRTVRKLGGRVVFSQVMRVSVDMSRIRWKITLPQAIKRIQSGLQQTPKPIKVYPKDIPPELRRIIDLEEWLN